MKHIYALRFFLSFILLVQAVSGHSENDKSAGALLAATGIKESLQQECPDPFVIEYRVNNQIDCGDEFTVANGSAEAYVLIDGQEVSEGYTFNWYEGTEKKVTPDYTGTTYDGLQAGTYSLEVIHIESGCAADLQQLSVELEDYPYEVRAELLSANTGCEEDAYNGALRATVVDAAGVEVEGDFTFSWYPAAVAGEAEHVIGVGSAIEGLSGGEYTVIMTDNITACSSTATITVPDESVQPVLSVVSIEEITQCGETQGGAIEVGLDEEGDYTIHWYTGNAVLEENKIPGEDGLMLSGYPAGVYTAQAVNVGTNCISNAIVAEIQDNTEIPEMEISTTNITSCNAANGTATASATVGESTENIVIEWYSGEQPDAANLIATVGNGETLGELAAGSYTVLAIDQVSGCTSAAETITLTDETSLPLLEIAAVQHVNSCDLPDGSAEVYVLADGQQLTEGYTFNWYAGSEVKETPDYSGPAVTGLAEGTYSVEAIDNTSGCVSELLQLTIQEEEYPYEVQAALVSANTGCEVEAYNGVLRATVVDAAGDEYTEGDFTFSWYPAAVAGEAEHVIGMGPTIEGLSGGEYTVIMTDNITACTSSATAAVPEETVQPQLTLQVSQQIARCDNPAAGEIQASLNVEGNYTMHWYTGEAIEEENRIAGEEGMSLSGYPAGTYTALAVNNATLCVSTIETVVIEDLTASPEVSGTIENNTACDPELVNGSIILTISTPLPGADPEGGYEVVWYSGSSAEGTPLDVSGIMLENLEAGSYTAVVTNPESGCSSQHTFMVEDELAIPALSLAAMEPNTVCNPELAAGGAYTGTISLDLLLSGAVVTDAAGYTISWYVVEGETETLLEENATLSREELPAGRYKVVATRQASGCISEPLILDIEDATQTPVVEAVSVGPVTHCDTPNGEIEIAPEGGGEAGEYLIEWYQGNEPDADTRLEELTDQYVVAGLAAGTYTVQSTHRTTGCQSAPLSLVIEDAAEAPSVTVEATPLTNCNPNRPDGAFSFSVEGETDGYAFMLYSGSEPDASALVGEGPEITDLPEGEYLLVVTDDATSCVSSSLLSIDSETTFPEPPVTIGAESCEAAELTLSVEGEEIYYWYDQPTGGDAFHAGNSLFRNFEETVTYYVSTVNEDGCESRERSAVSAVIHELAEPLIEADDNVLSTTLDESLSYQWYLDGEPLAETGHTVEAEVSGSYTVEVTNEWGCSSRSAPYAFTVSAVIDNEYDAAIRVYPNPFRDRLHISLAPGAGITSIRIMDGRMRQLRNLTITGGEELSMLDLSALPQGMYYIEIREGEKVTYKRIVRQ